MSAPASRPQTIGQLAALLGGSVTDVALEGVAIRGLADDSRRVAPGDVFFARRGSVSDGSTFAADAVRSGAVAVVSERPLPGGQPGITVASTDDALRMAADAWYGRPQDALDLVGITGTKGKTTTAYLAAAAIRAAGRKTALIGTIEYDLGDGESEVSNNTTPGLLDLRRLLARARDAGCTAVVLEVSSHALDQHRVDGLSFRSAVLTNLASDHMDYHQSPEAYFEAKASLFTALDSTSVAVLNREDGSWRRFARHCAGAVLTYGFAPEADLRAVDVELTVERTTFRLVVAYDGCVYDVPASTTLIGRHNVMNLLAAVGAAIGLGLDPVVAAEGAATVAGVPGRLERVVSPADLSAFVDYAHTEDALVQVLTFLRSVGAEPLTCVVGCGGDRDTTKRPRMGRVAAELADQAIFTSDNPRGEDPQAILDEMMRELDEPELRERVTQIVDRREAIQRAVGTASSGSTVLVAGKGHERYQILGTRRLPFDDVHEVRAALEARTERIRDGGLS